MRRAVEYGAQHRGHGGDVERLVPSQQPRQTHELAVPAEHPCRPVGGPLLLPLPALHLVEGLEAAGAAGVGGVPAVPLQLPELGGGRGGGVGSPVAAGGGS